MKDVQLTNAQKDLYTVAEVAELLHCDKHLVYKLIKTGELKSRKIGVIMVAKVWIEDFLNSDQQSN